MPDLVPTHCIIPEKGSRDEFKRALFATLVDDFTTHHVIKRALVQAGFFVFRVNKLPHHHVFEIKMRRCTPTLNDTDAQIRRKVRRA